MQKPVRMSVVGGVGLVISLGTAACGGSRNPIAPTTTTIAAPASTTVTSTVVPQTPFALPSAVMVSGVVFEITEEGRVPVKNAYVEACGWASAETDNDGLFTLEVPTGTPSLFIQKPGFTGVSVVIASRMEVRLERP